MRAISFLATTVLLSIMAFTIKILDNLYNTFIIMIVFTLTGYMLSRIKDKPAVADIGWGILYGSLTAIALTGGFLVWLIYNFPK